MIKLYPFNDPELILMYIELTQKERLRKLAEQRLQNEEHEKDSSPSDS